MTRRRRAAVLLEMLAALGLFVAAGLAVIGATRRALATVERTTEAALGTDLASTAFALLQSGAATPESLLGPADPRSAPSNAGADDEAGDLAEARWSLRIETEPSAHDGLAFARIAAVYRDDAGAERTVASAEGLFRLRSGGGAR